MQKPLHALEMSKLTAIERPLHTFPMRQMLVTSSCSALNVRSSAACWWSWGVKKLGYNMYKQKGGSICWAGATGDAG